MIDKLFAFLLGIVLFGAIFEGSALKASVPSQPASVTSTDLASKRKIAEAASEKAFKTWQDTDAELKKANASNKKQAEDKNLVAYQNYQTAQAAVIAIQNEEESIRKEQLGKRSDLQKEKRQQYLKRLEEAKNRETAKNSSEKSIWTTVE